jgi:hypothetical protein
MGAVDKEEIGTVTPADVAEILADLRPGSIHPSVKMWAEYVKLMEAQRRPFATRTALGRALTAAGAVRQRRRKKVRGKIEETHCWVIPGSALEADALEADRVRMALAEIGPGIWPNDKIYNEYILMGQKQRWGGLMGRTQFARLLTKMKLVRMVEKGFPSRYVPPEKIWPGGKPTEMPSDSRTLGP